MWTVRLTVLQKCQRVFRILWMLRSSNTYYVYLHNFIGCQVRYEWDRKAGEREREKNVDRDGRKDIRIYTIVEHVNSSVSNNVLFSTLNFHTVCVLFLLKLAIVLFALHTNRMQNTMKIEPVPINNLHCKWKKHGKGGTLRERTTTTATKCNTTWWLSVDV